MARLSVVTMGGFSRPRNAFCRAVERPVSTPIYAPDNSVPRPEMPSLPTRGRNTQNRVPCVANFPASLLNWMLTMTRRKSPGQRYRLH